MSIAAPALAPDLVAALKRLKLRRVRTIAPEEPLRTLVEAECAAREEANRAHRLRAAGFPVAKTLEEFDLRASSVKRSTFDYLASLEWIRARENLVMVGPAGMGKSHLLIALGHAALEAGMRVRYLTASRPGSWARCGPPRWPGCRRSGGSGSSYPLSQHALRFGGTNAPVLVVGQPCTQP